MEEVAVRGDGEAGRLEVARSGPRGHTQRDKLPPVVTNRQQTPTHTPNEGREGKAQSCHLAKSAFASSPSSCHSPAAEPMSLLLVPVDP